MATISRLLPAALGIIAIAGTTALLITHIILAQSMSWPSVPTRITAILSSVSEAFLLVALTYLSTAYFRGSTDETPKKHSGVVFGITILLVTLSTALSVAALVGLGKATTTLPATVLGAQATSFLIGSAVVLGLSSAAQVLFAVVHFIVGRALRLARTQPKQSIEENFRFPMVKGIPYSQTTCSETLKSHRCNSMESRTPPSSSGGRSAAETAVSFQSSLSTVVRPMNSKTRLLSPSQRSIRSLRSLPRGSSLDSNGFRVSGTGSEDGFDSWDTSAAIQQTVLEAAYPAVRSLLEPIPASPATSRSPSPGCPLDLPPPHTRRSRSYSPLPSRSSTPMLQSASSESNIHPLFRSDTPTPPPVAMPGTNVMAAPNAGQVLHDRHSIRSLRRARSGSLTAACSPLSQNKSSDSLRERGDSASPELLMEEAGEDDSETERKMTPPIPDWILSAGARSSLTDYNSRKLRDQIDEATGQS